MVIRTAASLALAALITGCCGKGGPPEVPQEQIDGKPPEALRLLLEEIGSREDYKAVATLGRIYARLCLLGEPDAAALRTLGNASDVALLSLPAPPELKTESAARLAQAFLEKEATSAGESEFPGPLGASLRRYLRFSIAARFAEYSSSALFAKAAAAQASEAESLSKAPAQQWFSTWLAASALAVRKRAAEVPLELTGAARKFCEQDVDRHLADGVRCADYGTREKTGRGENVRILEWYLQSLEHFLAARACLREPGPVQAGLLGSMEIVSRSLLELVSREP